LRLIRSLHAAVQPCLPQREKHCPDRKARRAASHDTPQGQLYRTNPYRFPYFLPNDVSVKASSSGPADGRDYHAQLNPT
jgi:hypothetical protein